MQGFDFSFGGRSMSIRSRVLPVVAFVAVVAPHAVAAQEARSEPAPVAQVRDNRFKWFFGAEEPFEPVITDLSDGSRLTPGLLGRDRVGRDDGHKGDERENSGADGHGPASERKVESLHGSAVPWNRGPAATLSSLSTANPVHSGCHTLSVILENPEGLGRRRKLFNRNWLRRQYRARCQPPSGAGRAGLSRRASRNASFRQKAREPLLSRGGLKTR